MIKINKPAKPPAVLLTKGVEKVKEHCQEYASDPAKYQSGELSFNFNRSIYGHSTVKSALIKAQLKKCCFCETKVGEDGDVEHFRPKSASRQVPSQSLIRPGYYWLAYDWDNLLLACPACNSRHKGNSFPLENPKQRARSDQDDCQLEKPIFINPAQEDPEKLISFREEIPYAIRGNKRARQTIELLGLDREIMNERRRDHLNIIRTMQYIVAQEREGPATQKWADTVAFAKQFIVDSVKDEAQFAGMARALNL